MSRHRVVKPWGSRIVRTGTERAGDLLANEHNWRGHPMAQQDVLANILNAVGFVAPVIVNLRTDAAWERDRNVQTLVDGHLRVALALSRSEDAELPVSYVDLAPDEEAAVLASFDPIAAMATTDYEKHAELIASVPDDLGAIVKVLEQERSQIPAKAQEPDDGYVLIVECETAEQRSELRRQLKAEGFRCRAERTGAH